MSNLDVVDNKHNPIKKNIVAKESDPRISFADKLKEKDLSVLDPSLQMQIPDTTDLAKQYGLKFQYANNDPASIREMEAQGFEIVPSDFLGADSLIHNEINVGTLKNADGTRVPHTQILMACNADLEKRRMQMIDENANRMLSTVASSNSHYGHVRDVTQNNQTIKDYYNKKSNE